jgi:hypothetical protein
LSGTPAHAAGVRDCTTLGRWTFDQPLTAASTSGSVRLDGTTICLRYTVGSGFTTEHYSAWNYFQYSGNCQAMTLTIGTTTIGAMLAEQTIAYANVPGLGTPGVHVVAAHPTCAGATVLDSVFHWVHVMAP